METRGYERAVLWLACGDCRDEGKSEGGSTYLDWPDVVDGRTLCARHATQPASVSSSSKP